MSRYLLVVVCLSLLPTLGCDVEQGPTATRVPTPTPTATLAPTHTPPANPGVGPSPTLASTPTFGPAPMLTATPAPTPSPTQSPSPTPPPPVYPSPGPSPTLGPTPMPTATPSPTPSPTRSPTGTPLPVGSLTWRGITLAPEHRCSAYNPDEYRYSQSVELRIVDAQGGIYGPYTGTWFDSIRDTDIEHIVARSEAHDSGLCAAGNETRAAFASDLLNLTLASPSVNRHQKIDKDAAEWLPELNRCWYVDRIIQVRLEYGLTIDRAEAAAIDAVLATCDSTEMVLLPDATATPAATATSTPSPGVDALGMYDDNGNGRISCAEARNHGIAPVRRGHPAYPYMRDADGDGIVCE